MSSNSHPDTKQRVAVVANEKKMLGSNDLTAMREALKELGFKDPIWYPVPKSKKAPKKAKQAQELGADVLLVWGGDGTVRRCIAAVAGSGMPIGILPAGSANLLAHNLAIEIDLDSALETALGGTVETLDVGVVNGERFAVMAGIGFDAVMVREADDRKERLGRLAYIVAGLKAIQSKRVHAKIDVDGRRWFSGPVSCVLLGNVGTATGGLKVFPEASTNDGLLEIGVVTAHRRWEWVKVLVHLARGKSEDTTLVHTTRGEKVKVRLNRKMPWELDGGDRKPTRQLKAKVERGAIGIRVP